MRYQTRFNICLVVGILLASVTCANAEDRFGVALKLDHFKFYRVAPVKANGNVALRGQFDKEPVPAMLPTIALFANPVSKDGAKILNPNAHLTWYVLLQRLKEPKRAVEFENQFGRQEILIGKPVAMLVPTEKIEEGSMFPERLDHYKVYVVLEGRPIMKRVTLKDQFGADEGVTIAKTLFFAVPVVKKHGDKVHQIVNEKGHLTFYAIVPRKPIKMTKETADQFGKRKLEFVASELLALPTLKLAFKAIGD